MINHNYNINNSSTHLNYNFIGAISYIIKQKYLYIYYDVLALG